MATGLRVPVGVSSGGGSALADGEENDRKVIYTALGACDSENAFQQGIGLGDDMVFDLNDNGVRARIMRRLVAIFDDFERLRRYKLRRETVRWTRDSASQELRLEFRYFNLETDEEKLFTRAYASSRAL